MAKRAGRIDVCCNAIGIDHIQGTPLVDLSLEDYALPVTTYAKAHGVASGFGVACAAVEGLSGS